MGKYAEIEIGLPSSIEAAWGIRPRTTRGPKPGLSLERIVASGVRLAADEGLDAVSMNRLATEMGAGAMSLYRYVSSKAELLELMVDAALGPPPAVLPQTEWRQALEQFAWGYREALRRHTWILRVPITAPPVTPNQVAFLEGCLAATRHTGLNGSARLSIVILLSGYVRSEATLITEIAAASMVAGSLAQAVVANYGQMLLRLTDPVHFPSIHELIASGTFDPDGDPDAEFVFGLGRLLDGIDSLIRTG
jgi:AcrR family transcriptional regulator